MKKNILVFLLMALSGFQSKAQVKIGDNPVLVSPGSLLELESTSKALTLPRMNTVQMQAIASPLAGMIVFNIDSNCIYLYKNEHVWASISVTAAPSTETWPYQSNDQLVGVNGNGKGIVSRTGAGLIASGDYSHAEGLNAVSQGNYSWSSGYADTAIGNGSVAMGFQNKTSGVYSVAMGVGNIVNYQSGVALGQGNADSGWASMAVGLSNKIGNQVSYSNALGYNNQLNGGISGNVFGEANKINSGRGNTGMGYANIIEASNFTNALGSGNDILGGSSHIAAGENNTIKSGNANSLLGQNNIADGNYVGAIGKDNIVYFQSAVALGQTNKDSGFASIALGLGNTIYAGTQYSNAFGHNNQLFGGSSGMVLGENNVLKTGVSNSVLGQNNIADGSFLGAIGKDNIVFYQSAIALGQANKDSGYATLAAGLGNIVKSGVQYGSLLGYNNQLNSGSSNTAIGESNTMKSGRASMSAGYLNIVDSSNFSNALGSNNEILKGNSHIAAGDNNTIRSGNANSIFGQNNLADGSYLGSIGKDNIVYYQAGVALGQGNKDSGYASIAAGLSNTVSAGVQYSLLSGYNNQVNSGTSHTAGGEANIVKSGNSNTVFGNSNYAEGSYLGAIGKDNIVYNQSSVALGQGNKDSGYISLSAGFLNTIRFGVLYSTSLGYNNLINAGTSNTVLGESNIINSGKGNTNAGYINSVSANYSSLFGTSNDVLGGNSHIVGGENNTVKTGNANSVFGQNNIADGSYLGAIGRDNSLFYQSGVALGQGNKDSGYASIAGGLNNVLEKNVQYSSSFGYGNLSTSNLSFASGGSGTFSAGVFNINSGYSSIALGSMNNSSNAYSLAANHGTIANSNAMSAFGHFNDTIPAIQGESNDPNEMLFAIGNGSNNGNRRNSFTMLRNGFTTINTTTETGVNTPRAELDIRGTGAIIVPVGTTAERPATAVTGMIRFCTDCPGGPVLQGFDGTNWVNL